MAVKGRERYKEKVRTIEKMAAKGREREKSLHAVNNGMFLS